MNQIVVMGVRKTHGNLRNIAEQELQVVLRYFWQTTEIA
jgi:hypothetical protein